LIDAKDFGRGRHILHAGHLLHLNRYAEAPRL
jgi:hypothetical protein